MKYELHHKTDMLLKLPFWEKQKMNIRDKKNRNSILIEKQTCGRKKNPKKKPQYLTS